MWFEDNIKRERKTQSKKQLANFLTKKPELIPVLTKKKKRKGFRMLSTCHTNKGKLIE